MDWIGSTLPAAAVPVTVKMPGADHRADAETPSGSRAPASSRSRLSGSSEAAISASMLSCEEVGTRRSGSAGSSRRVPCAAAPSGYRLRWPLTIFCHFAFLRAASHPGRAWGLGAAFLRAARLASFRSALSVIFFVFILRLSPAYFSNEFLQTVTREAYRQLRIVAFAFTPQHRPAAVFRMVDDRPGARSGFFLARRLDGRAVEPERPASVRS